MIGDIAAAQLLVFDEDLLAGDDQELVAGRALDEDALAIARQEQVPGKRCSPLRDELLRVAGDQFLRDRLHVHDEVLHFRRQDRARKSH